MHLRLLAPFAATTLLACGACQTAPKAPHCTLVTDGFSPPGTVAVMAETVVTGLEVPWGLAFLPNGDLLVTERPARIRLVSNGQLVAQPVATPPAVTRNEAGLLGLALHPDFASNRLFYIYLRVEKDGKQVNRVERWTLAEDHRSATFERIIVDDIPAGTYHDGGRLRFGPDGMLYIGTGDARDPDLSQDRDSLAGKLLRVTPDGEAAPGNPFGNRTWLFGIRNTQGWDWRDADTLLLTDHGPSGDTLRTGHDEVTVAVKGDNLGWPTIYGCEAKDGLLTPSISFENAAPPGGAALYTGTVIPEWRGSLLVGTLKSRHLLRVVFDEAEPRRVARHESYFLGEPPAGFGRLREVLMGPDGHLYV
ncbi:MAG: PQQ-dependent sugar dehydrogenase, partial [Myxococcales bacterium]